MIATRTMRRLDRWLGIPLCFLATWLRRLFDRRGGNRAVPPQRLLFIELSEMGSAILADPAMRHARDRLGATPYFVIFEHNRDSLDLTGTVPPERTFTLSTASLGRLLRDLLRFARWCRRERIDTCVDLELFARFTALLGLLSGARNRVGFHRFAAEGLYRGDLLTHRVGYQPQRHMARNFLALVAALDRPALAGPQLAVAVDDLDLTLPRAAVRVASRARVQALLAGHWPDRATRRQELVLVSPSCGAHLPQRRWPAPHFVALIERLLAARDPVVVGLIGSAEDRPLCAGIAAALGSPRCADLAGAVALADLPALFEAGVLLLANDSGPAHFAATADLPSVVLFGPETPLLYRPLGHAVALSAGLACSPCVSAYNHRVTACSDNACMRAIDVDTVLATVTRLLDDGRRTPRLVSRSA